jgi:hypothetical protein
MNGGIQMTIQWETVEVPRGAYISWGSKPGQKVVGKVVAYAIDGGTDFAGNKCPNLAVELIESTFSVDKEGTRTEHAKGELIQLNAGQVSLKRALRAADPAPGDLVQIALERLVKTGAGTVKEFAIQIARGAASNDTDNDDEANEVAPF